MNTLAFVACGIFFVSACDEESGPRFKVAFLPDTAGRSDDKTFNQSANEGGMRAVRELGVEFDFASPQNLDVYGDLIDQLVEQKTEMIICVGFLFKDIAMASALKHPETKFAIVDVAYDDAEYPPNLMGIVFEEDQVGYLAGQLAAKMTTSKVIGCIGGMAIPPVKRFCNGFRQGALAGCTCNNGIQTIPSPLGTPLTTADCPTLSETVSKLDVLASMACSCPTKGSLTVGVTYTGDFVCPKLGQAATDRFLTLGGDVLFAAAGGLGSASILHAAKKPSPPYVIGVDMDEYYTTFNNGTEAGKERLLTSAMKRVDVAVFEAIKATKAGQFVTGTKVLTAADDGIGLAPWHDAESAVSGVDGLTDRLSDTLASLKRGEIDTGVDAATGDLKAGKATNP